MHLPQRGRQRSLLAVSILLATLSPAAFSQSHSDIESIRAQIEALRAEQARIAEMQRQTDAKIQALEASLGVANSTPAAPAQVASSAADSSAVRLNVTGFPSAFAKRLL